MKVVLLRFTLLLLAASFPDAVNLARGADWLIDSKPFPARATLSADAHEITLENGLIRRVIRLQPNAATVAFDNLMTGASLLRSVRPEARIELNGQKLDVGGLLGQPVHNYLSPAWLSTLKSDPNACQFAGQKIGRTEVRFPWQKRPEWLTDPSPWPPPGVSVTLTFQSPPSSSAAATVEVHYELYDGLPLMSKWLTVRNNSAQPVTPRFDPRRAARYR